MSKKPSRPAQPSRSVSFIFFFLFLGLMTFEAGRLFWPFIGAIGSAIVLAVVFRPMYDALARKFPRVWPTFRALLLTALVVFLFVLPVALLIWSAVAEAGTLYPIIAQKWSKAVAWIHGSPMRNLPWLKKLPPSVVSQLDIRSEQVQQRLSDAGQQLLALMAGAGTLVAKQLFSIVMDLIMMVFSLFFMFRDGGKMYAQFLALIPLSAQAKTRLSQTIQRTIVGVVRGTFLMSLAQTLMMTVGLLIIGADGVVLLSFLTFVATFVPSVGNTLISVPVGLYFLFAVAKWKGFFLLIWGTAGVGLLDNVLRPFLIGTGEEMSFFWLVFSILGGLEAFGLKGLLLGPLILSLMPVLFEIYRERYLDIPEDEIA
jgi:predicted PurR-regulated permease PerM